MLQIPRSVERVRIAPRWERRRDRRKGGLTSCAGNKVRYAQGSEQTLLNLSEAAG